MPIKLEGLLFSYSPIINALIITFFVVSSIPTNAEELKANLLFNEKVAHLAISQSAIRSIFAMRTSQWSDDTPIEVFVLEDSNPIHIAFCKQVLGMFPYQLRGIWDRQVYSGTGVAPTTVYSVQEMRERIQNTDGGVGYILTKPAEKNFDTWDTDL